MKKFYFAIFALISGNSFCQTTVTFEDFTLSGSETYFDGSDMSGTSNGTGLFQSDYNEGLLRFSSIYDTTWGASSGYWAQGWAFSNETPDNLTGYAGLFSSFAGGGDVSNNYVIGQNNARIIKTNSASSFQSLRITNNNYAASSMQSGDSFAKAFGGVSGDDPDFFLVSIIGIDASNIPIDTVEFYLADYRFVNNTQDYIVKNWTTVDLTAIANAEYIDFVLSSSDSSGGYMNTPGFFSVDNVVHSSAVNIIDNLEENILIYPNPVVDILNITNTSLDQQILISNIQGQVVKSMRLAEGLTSINVANLPVGFYQMTILSKAGAVTKKFQKI